MLHGSLSIVNILLLGTKKHFKENTPFTFSKLQWMIHPCIHFILLLLGLTVTDFLLVASAVGKPTS